MEALTPIANSVTVTGIGMEALTDVPDEPPPEGDTYPWMMAG